MFDNLRDLSDEPLYEDETNGLHKDAQDAGTPSVATPARKSYKRKSKKFLGMTAQQRFILSVMVMLTVCMVGTLAMFVLGRMSIF
jgi:hypothetical protein